MIDLDQVSGPEDHFLWWVGQDFFVKGHFLSMSMVDYLHVPIEPLIVDICHL